MERIAEWVARFTESADIIPLPTMTYTQKIVALMRFIILVTILLYIVNPTWKIGASCVASLLIIGIAFMSSSPSSFPYLNEGFESSDSLTPSPSSPSSFSPSSFPSSPSSFSPSSPSPSPSFKSVINKEFKQGTKKNPFSNVLLTQIGDTPNRNSAPPAFNLSVSADITRNIKKMVQMLNPGIKNTDKQLFGDLWQETQLDNCARNFYSTPNTVVVPGDQTSFSNYLYADMKYSAKLDTPEGAMARVQDNTYRTIMM